MLFFERKVEMNFFLSYIPMIIIMIYYYYNYFNGRSINMTEGIIVGLIGLLGGAIGIVLNNLFNFSDIKEKLSEKHTLEKAKKYHDSTMAELEKEFDSNRERILDAKEEIKDISSSVSGISTDIQLMSKDIENHVLNLKEVRIQEPNLVQALKIFEGYIQELGKAERQIQTLENEKGQLISQYEKEIRELKLQIDLLEKDNLELHEQNEKLLSKYKDVIENDDFGLEI